MAISYNKKSWRYGDVFTPDVMNNIENGIQNATDEVNKKVNAVSGKTLSTNDYTNADKTIVAGVSSSQGQNIFPFPYASTFPKRNIAGVDYELLDDGGIRGYGTPTSSSGVTILRKTLPKGTYSISGVGKTAVTGRPRMRLQIDGAYNDASPIDGKSGTFTLEKDSEVAVAVQFISYNEPVDFVFYPMLEIGEIAHEYQDPKTSAVYLYEKISENDGGYKPYQSGLIHFTVPVNQYTSTYTTGTDVLIDNENNIVNVNAVLQLPTNYNNASSEQTPLIIVCHGAGYGVTADTWGTNQSESANANSSFRKMVKLWVDNGYAVCDVNGYSNTFPQETWGCPRVIQAYRKLYDYVISNYNVKKNVFVYGFSMGGLVALNFIRVNRDIVSTVALGAPVCGLYQACWNTAYGAERGWRASSAVAYDFQGISGTTWTTTVPPSTSELTLFNNNALLWRGYDPMSSIMTFNSKDYLFATLPPIRMFIGTADTAIGTELPNKLTTAITNAGGVCSIRNVIGGHGISYGDSDAVNKEVLYWFNRFRCMNTATPMLLSLDDEIEE